MDTTVNYQFFTAKEIRPSGWLKRQLEIQANGLAGNLDKVWPDVRDSKWIGGTCEGWERVPYWLDGFIPLAYLLEDADMIARARKYVDAIIAGQQADGWICPCTEEERPAYDMWALLLLGKILTVYYDCSGDERIPDVLIRAYRQFADHLEKYPLFNWGKFRWFEGLITTKFLSRFTRDSWLKELENTLYHQGFDYESFFRNWNHTLPERRWTFETHVVNLSMALKQQGICNFVSGDLAERMYLTLQRDHGMACGHFTGDECLAGLSPVQGSELCGVAEAMYSMEWLAAGTGKTAVWADRLERLAFNAFPATTSADMWTHQYDQQTNQIGCAREAKAIYGTNGGESNLFGLEPNYGCCTANMGQAWPKFILSAWMHASEDELLNISPVPSLLTTAVNGTKVKISIESDYPFKGNVKYAVECEKNVEFTLSFRIPGFAASAKVNGVKVDPGSLFTMRQIWNGRQEITLEMTFDIKMVQRPADMFCVWRGPLLFSLPIPYYATKMEYTRSGVERKFPYCDYELDAIEKWNYGFAAESFTAEEHPVPEMPFDPEKPAVTLNGEFAEISWNKMDGYRAVAEPQPQGTCRAGVPSDTLQTKQMIPYACAKLRMTEMPLVPVIKP